MCRVNVDTQIGVLKQTQTFFRWCVSKAWAKADPLEKVEVIGRRKKGKRQFVGVDESRRFLAKALELVKGGDTGALAAATALLMGMRASEIAERTVRELDDGERSSSSPAPRPWRACVRFHGFRLLRMFRLIRIFDLSCSPPL